MTMKNKFEVRKSNIEGSGVFATSDYENGAVICEFKGERLTVENLKEKYKSGEERIDDPFQVGADVYLDLCEPYVYFNHSCDPNAGMKGSGTLFAIRPIKKGEEITFDYSSTEDTDDKVWGINWTEKWRIPCKCGAGNCRKEIRVFSLLPEEIRDRYYNKGALMDFIICRYELRAK